MKTIRCAIYTRKSSEEGLEQSFNSLDAQREACEAYILSQKQEGWQVLSAKYDDGGFSGGNIERPALKQLLKDVAAKKVDIVVVYKVDRLTRSLADFAKIVEQFDQQEVSFVSVTQQFNTTSSMGRLTLNVLLSFAQFEREVTGERIRDKIAASKRKGMWMGGVIPLGYDLDGRRLVLNAKEAIQVREIFEAYLEQGCVSKLRTYLEKKGVRSKLRLSKTGNASGGKVFSRGAIYELLQNRLYRGEIAHKGTFYPGEQPAIIDQRLWDRVQAQFKANLQAARTRPRSSESSLLAGLLYDSEGNRFTPTHTNRHGRRYRYYTSQVVIKNGAKGKAEIVRLPAKEIETLVLAQITSFIASPQRLMDSLLDGNKDPKELQRMLQAIQRFSAKANELLPKITQRIVVHEGRIEITINSDALLGMILGQSKHGQPSKPVRLEIPAALKRCGGETRFLLPPGATDDKLRPVPSLVRAIARARDWVDQIMSGKAADQRTIAKLTGLNERYVSRLLPLAFLSPDLTEAILDGKDPAYLDLDDCLGKVAIDWTEQRTGLHL